MAKGKRRRNRKRIKGRPPRQTTPLARPREESTTSARRCWWKVAKPVGATIAAIVGLSGSLAGIWGPFWPTRPYIHPAGTDPGSPFSLPFTVANRSVLFPLKNARVSCIISRVDIYKEAMMKNITLYVKEEKSIPPGSYLDFRCRIEVPSYSVSSAVIRIRVSYDIRFLGVNIWHSDFESPKFTWARTSLGGTWIQ